MASRQYNPPSSSRLAIKLVPGSHAREGTGGVEEERKVCECEWEGMGRACELAACVAHTTPIFASAHQRTSSQTRCSCRSHRFRCRVSSNRLNTCDAARAGTRAGCRFTPSGHSRRNNTRVGGGGGRGVETTAETQDGLVHPTKLVVAATSVLAARHVVAATIAPNAPLATRARFHVLQLPQGSPCKPQGGQAHNGANSLGCRNNRRPPLR